MLSPRNSLQRLNCRQPRSTRLKPATGVLAPVHGIREACIARLAAAATDAAAAAAADAAEDAPAEQQLVDAAAVPEGSKDASASSSGRSTEEQTAALLSQIRAEVARRRNFAIISHPVSVACVMPGPLLRPENTHSLPLGHLATLRWPSLTAL